MKSIFLLLFFCLSQQLFAQMPPNFDLIKMEKAADYKNAEPFALQTAKFLLTTPFQKENPDRLKSLQFLLKWMSGTPDYSFTLDETATKLIKSNEDLLELYMAAMTQYTLENKESAKDIKKLKLNAIILVLDYSENKNNNIRMNKNLKKLAAARAKGELEAAL